MEEIDRESRVWAWANLGIGAAVTLIAGGMLMLFIRSRVQGQRAQLGMLKAMGASGAMIVEIGLREVVALWCLGLLGAVVLACGITLVVGSSLGWTSSVWRQLSLPWLGIVLASLGGLIVGVLSSLWATWGVSKEPPINLIRRTP
jgi:ABC-type antimicrobial peptide transport system permease subunit